jgi:hypothetical protein
MAEFTSATDAPAARAVIYATGFDHDIKLINLFHNGEVHDVATASFSAASVAAPGVGFSGPPLGFGTAFAPAEVVSSPGSSDNDDDDESSSFSPCRPGSPAFHRPEEHLHTSRRGCIRRSVDGTRSPRSRTLRALVRIRQKIREHVEDGRRRFLSMPLNAWQLPRVRRTTPSGEAAAAAHVVVEFDICDSDQDSDGALVLYHLIVDMGRS